MQEARPFEFLRSTWGDGSRTWGPARAKVTSVSFVTSLPWPGLCATRCLPRVISHSARAGLRAQSPDGKRGLTLSVQLYLHTSPLVQQVLIHPHWPFAHAVPSARNSLQLLLQDQESPTFSNKPSLIALAPMIILSFEIPGDLPSSVPSFNLTHVQHTCALGQALSWSQGDSAVDWTERSSLLPLCERQASAHCDSAET